MDQMLNALKFLEANLDLLAEFYPKLQLQQQIEIAKQDLTLCSDLGGYPFVALSFASDHAYVPNLTLTFRIDQTSNELKIKANLSSFICSSMEQVRNVSRLLDILGGNYRSISPAMFV